MIVLVLSSLIFVLYFANEGNGAFTSTRTQVDHCFHNDRDIHFLIDWASENSIHFSPLATFTTMNEDKDVGITLNKSLKASEKILSVPRSLVFDSHKILDGLKSQIQSSMDYISASQFDDSQLNFVLMVKVLYEYSLGEKSPWYPWLSSLPKTFNTGVCMDDVELSCLPPFAIALAEYERKKLLVFRDALDLLQSESDLLKELGIIGTDLSLWAFNVVQTRSWSYQDDGDSDRLMIVPLGDLFNHKDPANVIVDDSPLSDSIDFVLTQDIDITDSDSTAQLFLSYGLTNPYRFLIIFGFFDPSMPEIFCEVLFSNPSKEMLDFGCDDRSRMVYGTEDGEIADAIWDSVLYLLLDQASEDQAAFYEAHMENDKERKEAIHDKYIMETSLALRKHVMKTLNELRGVLRKIDAIIEGSSLKIVEDDHPRLSMIRQHNVFLYHTFDKVRQRIDARAKAELKRRKNAQGNFQEKQ